MSPVCTPPATGCTGGSNVSSYNDDDNNHQTDLAAEGVAVQRPELGDALHPGLRHLPLHWDGPRLLEQHRVPDN